MARGGPTPPQWAGLKFFNVYGPNEDHKGVMQSLVSKIFPAAKAGEPVTLFKSHNPGYPDGGQLRDFVYVKDCVAVVLWLLRDTRRRADCSMSEPGVARSFLDLVNAVFGSRWDPAEHPFRRHPDRAAPAISIFHLRRRHQTAPRRLQNTIPFARGRRSRLSYGQIALR